MAVIYINATRGWNKSFEGIDSRLMREEIDYSFGNILPTRAQSKLMWEKIYCALAYILPTSAQGKGI